MSVVRRTHATDDDINRQIKNRIAGEGRSYGGLAAVSYDEVRAIQPDDHRAFCVYDTATEEEHFHADICQAYVPPPVNKTAHDRAMRKELQEKFSGFLWTYIPPLDPHPLQKAEQTIGTSS